MLIYSYNSIRGLIVEIKTNIKIDIQKLIYLIYLNWILIFVSFHSKTIYTTNYL